MEYQIFQLKDKTHLFHPLRWWKGDYPERDMYDLKYEGVVEKKEGVTWYGVLEHIYHVFNTNKPEDFKGHSLSVSDIVGLNGKYYFCDSIGFVEIDNF
jgi:hypothetical protein